MKQSVLVLTMLRQLLGAHSPSEVAQIQSQFAELRQNLRVCEVQTTKKLVPDACYRALAREKAWNLIDHEQAKDLERKWDLQCESAAKQGLYADSEGLQVHSEDLSPFCRVRVQHSLEIHRYRWSEN